MDSRAFIQLEIKIKHFYKESRDLLLGEQQRESTAGEGRSNRHTQSTAE